MKLDCIRCNQVKLDAASLWSQNPANFPQSFRGVLLQNSLQKSVKVVQNQGLSQTFFHWAWPCEWNVSQGCFTVFWSEIHLETHRNQNHYMYFEQAATRELSELSQFVSEIRGLFRWISGKTLLSSHHVLSHLHCVHLIRGTWLNAFIIYRHSTLNYNLTPAILDHLFDFHNTYCLV
jgi:hypothetical protein